MLNLRSATANDWARLFHWRNDPDTRAASVDTEPVDLFDHMKWLKKTLADESIRLFVLEDQSQSRTAGTTRLDLSKDGKTAECSVTIDPSCRGRGYAQSAISLTTLKAAELGVDVVTARIRETNPVSLRAFTSAGFLFTNAKDGMVKLEWRR